MYFIIITLNFIPLNSISKTFPDFGIYIRRDLVAVKVRQAIYKAINY